MFRLTGWFRIHVFGHLSYNITSKHGHFQDRIYTLAFIDTTLMLEHTYYCITLFHKIKVSKCLNPRAHQFLKGAITIRRDYHYSLLSNGKQLDKIRGGMNKWIISNTMCIKKC